MASPFIFAPYFAVVNFGFGDKISTCQLISGLDCDSWLLQKTPRKYLRIIVVTKENFIVAFKSKCFFLYYCFSFRLFSAALHYGGNLKGIRHPCSNSKPFLSVQCSALYNRACQSTNSLQAHVGKAKQRRKGFMRFYHAQAHFCMQGAWHEVSVSDPPI